MEQEVAIYSISAVARMLDVPVATLRTGEDRYGQVVPDRSPGGQRLFTRLQVERLKFVRAQMSDGASAADAHRLRAERTEAGASLAAARAKPAPQILILLAEADPYAAEFQEYFLKTEGFDVGVTLTESAAREAFAAASPAIVIVEFLISGGAGLELCPAAALWIGEYSASEIAVLPEFAVADAIVELATVRSGAREMRFLQVRKLRGGGFRSGQHAYRLSREGLHLFPRLADIPAAGDYSLGEQRISTGLDALDAILADGFWPGASTLVAGPTGSGKTLMGLHFIFAGARQGEPGVVATLQENPTQLRRMLRGLGWPADDPAVELMYRSPVGVHIDEWVYDLLRTAERTGARRILLDSRMDLRTASPDDGRFREFMYSLVQRFSRQGVSLFMTYETQELFGAHTLSEFAVSHLSDNVIALNYYKDHGTLKRAISVIKTRASRHEPATRQYDIGSHGITIGGIAEPEGTTDPLYTPAPQLPAGNLPT